MADDWPLAIAHGRVAYCAFRATSVTVAAVDGDEVRVVALGAVPEAVFRSRPGLATFLAFDGGGAPRVSHHKVAAPEPAALAASRGGKALGVGSRPTVAEYALADPPPSGLLRAAAGALLGWLAPGARAPRGDGNARDGFADRRPYEDREGLRANQIFNPTSISAASTATTALWRVVDDAAGPAVRRRSSRRSWRTSRGAATPWAPGCGARGDGARARVLAGFSGRRGPGRRGAAVAARAWLDAAGDQGGWGGAGDGLSARVGGGAARGPRALPPVASVASGPASAARSPGRGGVRGAPRRRRRRGRARPGAALCAECFAPPAATPLTPPPRRGLRALLAPLRSGDVLGARASRDAAAALGLDAPMLVDLTCVVFSNLPAERLRASASSGALARWLQALLPADGDCGPRSRPRRVLRREPAARGRRGAAASRSRSSQLAERPGGAGDLGAPSAAVAHLFGVAASGLGALLDLRAPPPDDAAVFGELAARRLAEARRDPAVAGAFRPAPSDASRELQHELEGLGAGAAAAPSSFAFSPGRDGAPPRLFDAGAEEPQVLFDFKPKDDGEPQVMFDFKPKDNAADDDDW
ncbi:Rab3 GTPase-activating protein [Aureococcus anophagefferens]|nr:Rab3 GTPase-activating protein [Aureococcus anophagefferens]